MKKLMKIMPVVLVMCLVLTNVFADVPTTFPSGGSEIGTVSTAANNIWATVVSIVRILAFAAIVFAGVRYMFASADQKADIKKGMGYLAIGGLLVFASSWFVEILIGVKDSL